MYIAQNVCFFAKDIFQLFQETLNQLTLIHFVTLSYARVCWYWYSNVAYVICRVTSRYVFKNGRDVTCFSKWSLVSEEDKMSKR